MTALIICGVVVALFLALVIIGACIVSGRCSDVERREGYDG